MVNADAIDSPASEIPIKAPRSETVTKLLVIEGVSVEEAEPVAESE
jgi:hypothetical protein